MAIEPKYLESDYWLQIQSMRTAHKYNRQSLIDAFLASGLPRPNQEPCDHSIYPCHGEEMYVPSKHGDHQIRVLIYRPEVLKEKNPTIFYMHGGGFSVEYPEFYDYDALRFSNELGCIVVIPEYRLAPEDPFPAGLHDNYDAIEYFVDRAEEYQIDLERLGIAGDSAGGNYALEMSYHAIKNGKFKFRAQLLTYPHTDLSEFPMDVPNGAHPYVIAPERMMHFCANYASYDEVYTPEVSPVYIPEKYLRQMPPTILITAEHDSLRDQGERMGRLLYENGVPVLVKRYQNMPHGFILQTSLMKAEDKYIDEAWEQILAGLKAYLL